MEKFLEIIEQSKTAEAEIKIVKIKIKDKAEALEKLPEEEKAFVDKKYIARLHTCRHGNNGKNQPCSVEILKEVK